MTKILRMEKSRDQWKKKATSRGISLRVFRKKIAQLEKQALATETVSRKEILALEEKIVEHVKNIETASNKSLAKDAIRCLRGLCVKLLIFGVSVHASFLKCLVDFKKSYRTLPQ